MKRNYLFLLLVFVAMALSSCSSRLTVEKRRYNPGFYTSFSSDRKHLTDNGKTSKERKQNIDIAGNPDFSVIDEKEAKNNIYESEISGDNEIASVKKDEPAAYVMNKIRKADKTILPEKSKSETKTTEDNNYGDPGKDWMSVASFWSGITGLFSLILSVAGIKGIFTFSLPLAYFLFILYLVASAFAIVTGAISLRRIKKGIKVSDIKPAKRGLIIGIISLSLLVLYFVIGFAVFFIFFNNKCC